MMLGLSFGAFTTLHVVLSLAGIAAGAATLLPLLAGRWMGGWTAAFLATTALTVITGFLFPLSQVLPSHILGAITGVTLATAAYALYGQGMRGGWRAVFVVTGFASLYFNVFVGVVQAFQKIGALNALAPTQSEAPFAVAQLAVLALFLAAGTLALRRFRPVTAAA